MLTSKKSGGVPANRFPGTDLIGTGFSNAILLCCTAVFSLLLLLVPAAKAELATAEEMTQVCSNWLIQMVHEKGTWAGETNPQIVGANEIRSGDTLLARYYDISPMGFVVVPVLKEMTPIKAYSDESVLDERQEGGFLALLKEMLSSRMALYAREYGSLDAVQPPEGDAVFGQGQKAAWERLTKSSEEFEADLLLHGRAPLAEAGPLLSSSWHQGSPYKNLCPWGDGGRCVVGCVATATAQILHYWEWPAKGVGSHTYFWDGDQSCGGSTSGQQLSADYSDDYDWANIPDNCNGGCTSTENAALAELNYEVGVAFDMNYGACGSGAYTANALKVFPTYYKYSLDITKENRIDNTLPGWFSLIQEEINNGRPIQYRVSRHSIVCDGWRDNGQYEYHMNYGWGGSFNAWFVLDSLYCYWEPDSLCPADEEYMITHIFPQTEPVLDFVGQTLDDSGGDGDGHADVGESVELSLTIRNSGWDATDVTGVLSTDDPHVNVTTSTASFTDSIPWGDECVSQTPFVLSILGGCPDPHIVVLELGISSAGGYSTADTFYLFVGDTPGFEDDMEGAEQFWTHAAVTQMYYDEWHLENYRSHSSDTSWKAGGYGVYGYTDLSDAGLATPPFLLPSNAVLSFWHWIEAEDDVEMTAWDGAIVMISSGDGQWMQVIPDGGYPYTIIDNPVSPFEPGTPCFSGSHGWSEVVCDLSAYSGVAQIMFRFGSDGYVSEEGWYIDDIVVAYGGCCVDLTGNVNCDPGDIVDIGDVTRLIDYLFISNDPLCCEEEANANGSTDGIVDIGDLTGLIDYLFISNTPPEPCL